MKTESINNLLQTDILMKNNKEKERNDHPQSKKVSSKKVKDRKGIMGTGADLAYISDTLFDDDLKK